MECWAFRAMGPRLVRETRTSRVADKVPAAFHREKKQLRSALSKADEYLMRYGVIPKTINYHVEFTCRYEFLSRAEKSCRRRDKNVYVRRMMFQYFGPT